MGSTKKIQLFHRSDIILVIFFLALSLVGLIYIRFMPLYRETGNMAVVISAQGEITARISMGEVPLVGYVMEVEGPIGIHRIEVEPDRVKVTAPAADPLKICEKTGWIKTPGPAIVCIPNRLAVWLEGDTAMGLDGLAE